MTPHKTNDASRDSLWRPGRYVGSKKTYRVVLRYIEEVPGGGKSGLSLEDRFERVLISLPKPGAFEAWDLRSPTERACRRSTRLDVKRFVTAYAVGKAVHVEVLRRHCLQELC